MSVCKACRHRLRQSRCHGMCLRCFKQWGADYVTEDTRRERAQVEAIEWAEAQAARAALAAAKERVAEKLAASTVGRVVQDDGVAYEVTWDGAPLFEEAGA